MSTHIHYVGNVKFVLYNTILSSIFSFNSKTIVNQLYAIMNDIIQNVSCVCHAIYKPDDSYFIQITTGMVFNNWSVKQTDNFCAQLIGC